MAQESQDKKQTRIVITGVNGFVGKHLVRELTAHDIKVVGIGREADADPEISNLLDSYVVIDLVKEWVDIGVVDAVIHLAGLAAVGPSFDHPQDYINLNSSMVTNMAEHYLEQSSAPRLVVVSSGAVYDPNQTMPLNEQSAIGFNSPYTVSKILIENQCAYYRNRGLDCVIARPFNHIGPGQLGGFLVPDVISALKETGSALVGNISTKRDYTDVRDVVRAYRLLATAPNLSHTTYNICSGRSVSGEKMVNLIQESLNMPNAQITVDQSRVRPTDPPDIFGDASALNEDTGWQPEIPLETTIRDCVEEPKL